MSSILQFSHRKLRKALASARIRTTRYLSIFQREPMPNLPANKLATRASSLALFTRNFLKSPAMLGAVVPSSPFLVKDMMSPVDWDRARVLVEYGPGVGPFTKEILKR